MTVKPVAAEALLHDVRAPEFEESMVRLARERQAERAQRLGLARPWNGRIPGRLLPAGVDPTPEARAFVARRAEGLGLTGRGIHRTLRVARTIADVAGAEQVGVEHVEEAMGYREG